MDQYIKLAIRYQQVEVRLMTVGLSDRYVKFFFKDCKEIAASNTSSPIEVLEARCDQVIDNIATHGTCE